MAQSQTAFTVTKCLGCAKHDGHRGAAFLDFGGHPGGNILTEGDPALFQITKTLGKALTSSLFVVHHKLLLIHKCVAILYDFFYDQELFC